MKFTIVTPSYNQLDFLRRCIASVADQVMEGVGHGALGVGAESIEVHHHVQDGGSTDGTIDWLRQHEAEVSLSDAAFAKSEGQTSEDSHPNAQRPAPGASLPDYTFNYESVPDNGMYDAINRGFKLAIGGAGYQALGNNNICSPESSVTQSPTPNAHRLGDDSVIAWLNCDEQYLPGTLDKVAQWFAEHPRFDVCFGDVLVVDDAGRLICGRKMVRPSKYHIVTDQLPLYSAAMFIRASALVKHGLSPDPAWKNTGDVELVLRMINQGVRFGFLHEYASVFTDTGENLALDDLAGVEYAQLRKRAPWWVRRLRGFWVLNHRIRKLIAGCYHLAPVDYSIYVVSLSERCFFSEAKPESRWLSRL